MPNLILSTRALKAVENGINLFHHNGFHTVGIDKIVSETEITKMTFYSYFHSKQRFVDICLIVQKERLQDQVMAMMEYDLETTVLDKIKKLYWLHADIEGPYYLLFKAIFETKNSYPNAYQTAIRYRTWLTNEIYSQLRQLKTDVSFTDARLFLYMIDGAILQLLMSEQNDENERLLVRFLKQFKFSEPM